MINRVITGAWFTILLLAGIILGGWTMLALLSAMLVISTMEMYKAIRNTGIEPVRWAGYVFCGLTIAAECVSFYAPNSMNLSTIALAIGVMAAMARLVFRGKIAVESLMATVFPMLYPGIFYMLLMDLLHLESRGVVVVALVLAIFSASINDVFALIAGLSFGKHKLAPELSPKKTIEGSIGGLIASTLFSMAAPAIVRFLLGWNPALLVGIENLPPVWTLAILGLVAGGLSQIGDLTASMIKRHCGVKDFGKLLPGHGGIMDRMDGVLFCGAACYIFFKIAGLG
ncbi:MAG: phosphatidate cytidylyltransferase [Clostridia bacterium]|nr:phosphatidate cytidylyltransferase [Clostridia bacterium]